MKPSWKNCAGCGGRCKVIGDLCLGCMPTPPVSINLGTMDWRLFQRQRLTLINLTVDDRLDEVEQRSLVGILHLTDHIIDTAEEQGAPVPPLDDPSLTLESMADL